MRRMKQSDFWKNFHLGIELDIAGSFIYNGIRRLHEMETIYHESEVFEVLYNLAVGMERALKIAVILIEHNESVDQEEFEKTLITHSHQDLMRRVQVKHDLNLAAPHNEFLVILGSFYKTFRYGRYILDGDLAAEKKILHRYIEKNLKIKIEDDPPFQVTRNNNRIRKFVGKRVGKLITSLYQVIIQEASRLGIYTHDIRPDSKAAKIFLWGRFDFTDEEVLWKELLIYLLNTRERSGIMEFVKTIEPLPFDPGLTTEYLQCFESEEKKLAVLSELECLYEEVDDVKARIEMLGSICNSSVVFDNDEWEEEKEP